MLSNLDIIGKIQQLYREDRPVPYLSFMHMLNGLYEDLQELKPREPSDDLRELFRAACMCVNVGVLDTQDRGEDRIEEFMQHVVPLWKAKLPPDDFAKYENILEGRLRSPAKQGPAGGPVDAKAEALLAKLGLVPGARPQPQPEEPAALEPAEEEPVAEAPLAGAPEPEPRPEPQPALVPDEVSRASVETQVLPGGVDTIDGMLQDIRLGKVSSQYVPRQQSEEIGSYLIDGVKVGVKLAQADGRNYTVLKAEIGRAGVPNPRELLDLFAAEMRYVRMADYAYMREDDEFVYTLRVGRDSTNLACATAAEAEEVEVARRIAKLHMDMGELVERLQP
jgi:hypothetical protein